MGKKSKAKLFIFPTSDEEIEAYKRSDAKFKFAVGGFSLNGKPVAPKAFFKAVLCALTAVLILSILLAITGNLNFAG